MARQDMRCYRVAWESRITWNGPSGAAQTAGQETASFVARAFRTPRRIVRRGSELHRYRPRREGLQGEVGVGGLLNSDTFEGQFLSIN